jgi:hypothetical protein
MTDKEDDDRKPYLVAETNPAQMKQMQEAQALRVATRQLATNIPARDRRGG